MLRMYLSGGVSNSLPAASLGGGRSSTLVTENLIGSIDEADFTAGSTIYRWVYIYTDIHVHSAKIWITDTPSAATTVAIGWGTGTPSLLANQNTAPVGVTFSSPTSSGTAIDAGEMLAGASRALCIRYTITPTTLILEEDFSLVGEDLTYEAAFDSEEMFFDDEPMEFDT
jgi:hypothetical protein